jgi:hypothetical protein
MKVRIEGFIEKQGVIEGKAYHSIKVHCSKPFVEPNSIGREVIEASVQFDRLPYVVGRLMELSELYSSTVSTSAK